MINDTVLSLTHQRNWRKEQCYVLIRMVGFALYYFIIAAMLMFLSFVLQVYRFDIFYHSCETCNCIVF